MGAAAEIVVEVETATDTWTDITADTVAGHGLELGFGISGDTPTDLIAGTGECTFSVNGTKYSPSHDDVLSGWTYGAGIRVIGYRTSDAAQAVASVTRSSTTATVTTSGAHGYATGDWITIAGASPSGYAGTFQITVTAGTTFTYAVSDSLSTPASGTITARIGYVRHRGKLRQANPEPGAYRAHYVHVVSYDGMRDLSEARLRDVAVQINQTDAQVVTAILAALPAAAQPVAQSISTGVETFPYALDDLGTGATAIAVLGDVCTSAFGFLFMEGDGTLVYQTRDARATGTSAYTFNNTMHGLEPNATVDEFVNNVAVRIQPRTVDAAATTVIYQTTGTPIAVEAGQTVTLSVDYRDPDESQTLIGATAVVTPIVSGTDYAGNAADDGSGADLSSSLSLTTTAYASTATIAIQNTGAATVYLVNGSGAAFLQIRGKGIYRKSEQTYTATSAQPYGDRAITINALYLSNIFNAQSYADVVEAQFNQAAAAQIQAIDFIANDSDDLLLQAMARQPGDLITITETAVGASDVLMLIQSVSWSVTAGNLIRCTFGLAPASPWQYWLLGTTGRTELGETTTLGF